MKDDGWVVSTSRVATRRKDKKTRRRKMVEEGREGNETRWRELILNLIRAQLSTNKRR
jgi:hypothetical protein